MIVRWSPLCIIESTFPEHESHQHRSFIEEIFRSDIWVQLNLGQISEEDAKLKFICNYSAHLKHCQRILLPPGEGARQGG